MDSDNSNMDQDQFAKAGGEAMDLNGDFQDSEDADDMEEDDIDVPEGQPDKKDVKGEKLENQPYDLAVDVNDSEEIESDEEEDEVGALGEQAPGQAAQQ